MGTEPIEIVWPQPSIPPEGSEMNEEEVILAEGRWVRLVRRGTWEYLERRGRGDAAVLVPITAGGELILVEQLRKPFLRRTIELPAGLIGDEVGAADESALEAARRELEEETGYGGGTMVLAASGPVSPGLTTEFVHFFVARNLIKQSAGGGVPGEDIIVHAVGLADVRGWLAAKEAEGLMIDVKIWAGLGLL